MLQRESHIVIFLPFLRLASAYTVAGVEFVPLRMPDKSEPPSLAGGTEAIATVISSYRARNGEPFDNCVVATVPGRGWDLSDSDFPAVQCAGSLLFLASWARNEYLRTFGGNYVNSSSFRLVGQKFSGAEPSFIALVAKRRDGRQWDGGYNHGEVAFSLPLQCSLNEPASIDTDLLAALDKAQAAKTTTMERLRSALSFVSLANTDDDLMDECAEAILMASAFEQLMGGNEKAYKLAKLFGTLFAACGNVIVAEAIKARPGITIDTSDPLRAQAQPGWWVHRKWMEELHQLRSQAVHEGHARTLDGWGWNAHEHLLMAAHVFPLAVKALLEREGHYVLSGKDKGHCQAIDKILAVTDWDQITEDGPLWHQVMSAAVRHEQMERVKAELLSEYPDFFGDGGNRQNATSSAREPPVE